MGLAFELGFNSGLIFLPTLATNMADIFKIKANFMKQVIVIRKDLNMRKGKMVAQGSHASLGAYLNTYEEDQKQWMKSGQTKICVSVDSEKELLDIYDLAAKLGLPVSLIRDAGHTELEPNTLTAVGIGPCENDAVNQITGNLKLL